jgi:hypothetical protein
LLGFSIHRLDPADPALSGYLEGSKTFQATHPGHPDGSRVSTEDHPIQSSQWAGYSAVPGRQYTYTITALKGAPA